MQAVINEIGAVDPATTPTDEKVPMFRVYVIADGIKKRCRKSERHHLKAGLWKPESFPRDESGEAEKRAQQIARALISGNMKSTARATIHVDHVEVTRDEIGGEKFSCETWLMFDKRHRSYTVPIAP